MPSIRRRSAAPLDEGLDIMDVSEQAEPPTVRVSSATASATDLPPDLLNAPVGMEDDLSHALAAGPPRRRLPGATGLLAAAVLVAGGFLGGVITQKHEGGTGTSANTAASLAAAFRNRAGTTATGTGTRTGTATGTTGTPPGAGGGATVGTVKLVDGNKIYLTATDGSTIVVTTGPTTTIKVTKNGKASDLAPGSTVVVQGTAGSDGVVAATTVTQGGGTGGFGGFGGRTRTGTGTGAGAAGGGAGG